MDQNKNSKYFDLWAKKFVELPDKNSFHLRSVGKLIRDKYPQFMGNKDMRIVDLGIGNGRFLASINRGSLPTIVGIDASEEQLKVAKSALSKECYSLSLIKYNLEEGIPLKNQSADIIISNATFHHIKDKSRLFQEAYRVLNKNGVLVFFDFYFNGTEKDVAKETLQKQRRNSTCSKKFITSIRKERDLLPSCLKEGHPAEYHVPPRVLIESLKKAGFVKCEIIPTFYPKYVGIGGVK